MATEKIVKSKKHWECDNCQKKITPGQYYVYSEARNPRYKNTADQPFYHEEQVGIKYIKYRICLSCDEELYDKMLQEIVIP